MRVRVYPKWLYDKATEETKKRLLTGKVSSNEVLSWVCYKHGIYYLPLKKVIRVSDMAPIRGCPKCGVESRVHKATIKANKVNKELNKDVSYVRNKTRGLRTEEARLHRKQSIRKNVLASVPDWLINDLVLLSDKVKARKWLLPNHKLLFRCSKHGFYFQRLSDHIDMTLGVPIHGCPKCVS